MRAERTAIEEIAEQERRLLARVDDPALALQLHIPLGTIELCRGALDRAQEHLDQALALFDVEKHKWLFLSFAADPMVLALIHSGLSAWLSGRPDHARTCVERGLARAEEVSHPFTLAYALITAAMTRLCLRDLDEAWRLAQRGVSLAREHGFALYAAEGAIMQNCATLQRGEPQAGLATIAENLSAYRATGARLDLPFFLAFLAEGYLQAGRISDGLQVVTEALRLTETNLDVFWEAELYRLKGELLLNAERMANGKARPKRNAERNTKKRGRVSAPSALTVHRSSFSIHRCAEAETCFQQAIEVARSQGAKSLELRAVMSLSRLWQHQGKKAEARQVLAEIYGWFTEGLDTQDLQDAKALLEELGRGQ
jgi:predicted ATPase